MTIRGIDHVGVTVSSIEQATEFFVRALGAQVLYDTLPREDGSRGGEATDQRLGVPGGTDEIAIRMLRLPYGPGLELFEFTGPRQRDAAIPSDIEWQHVAVYADDLDAAAAQVVEAGGSLLAEPRPLPSVEAGERNRFVYARTPWGSTLEIISYPDEQPYNAGHGAAPLAALSRPWVRATRWDPDVRSQGQDVPISAAKGRTRQRGDNAVRRDPALRPDRSSGHHTKSPTIPAESSETRTPESIIRHTLRATMRFRSSSTSPLKHPTTIPAVEKLAKEVRKTVRTAW